MKLIDEAKEFIFEKDVYIFKEGDKANYLYVITRGSCTESTASSFTTLNETKAVGDIASYHNLINPTLRHTTSCIANAVVYGLGFNIITMQKIIKKITSLQEFVWKNSIHVLSKIYYTELKPFGKLD